MNRFLQQYFLELKKNFNNPELELRILLNKCSINQQEIILSNFKIKNINITKFKKSFNRRINKEPISKIFNNVLGNAEFQTKLRRRTPLDIRNILRQPRSLEKAGPITSGR